MIGVEKSRSLTRFEIRKMDIALIIFGVISQIEDFDFYSKSWEVTEKE